MHRHSSPFRAAAWRDELAEVSPRTASLPAAIGAAVTLLAHGRRAAAESLYRELLSNDPGHDQAQRGLAKLLRQNGRHAEANEHQQRVIERQLERQGVPEDERPALVEFQLAAWTGKQSIAATPKSLVSKHFDQYAAHFEQHLTERLQYRGPQAICDAVKREWTNPERLKIFDAGCGTGLMGVEVRPWARQLDGADLSSGMIEQARTKKIYDRLSVGDVVSLLTEADSDYDLVLAADVFCYLGDLRPVLTACRSALAPEGLLAFTTEASDVPGYQLHGTCRFVHHLDYVTTTAAACGFSTVHTERFDGRLQNGQPSIHLLGVFRRATDS